MEHAAVRDEVVSALLRLLKKRESFCCEVHNERKIRKNPTAAAKTDYNEMWSRAGKPFY